MDLSLSEEQEAIEELFGSLLTNECPSSVVRESEPLGFAPKLWEQFVATDATGMFLPEASGGGDASLLDAALVAEHIGRALAPVPFIEHVVAGRLLARAASDAPELAPIIAGDQIASLALQPAREGSARLVPAGAIASCVLALDGDALVLARSEPPGVAPANLASSPLADRELAGARVLLRGAEARAAHERALDEWRALTASALVGVAQGAFDLGLDYVKERHQFGVPIGSFQAIQHGMAEIVVPLDGARLLARKAAWAFDAEPDAAARLSGMAYLFAGEVAQLSATRCLHYHGGYGFSLEYDIQLYFRRAKGWAIALDDPSREYQHLADRILGPRSPR
jgi:alkylation response protein AidB-like acyl-CoA dehydrogenase